MKTLQVLSKDNVHDQNQLRQARLETAHHTCKARVNAHYTDGVDVCDTLDGFYRNNDDEVNRIYNIPLSLTHDNNNYYCILGIPCQGIQTFKACQCLCERWKRAARVCATVTFVLLLCCLVLGTELFHTVAWNVSPVESSQLKQQLKSNVNSLSVFTGLENHGKDGLFIDQLSLKNLSFGSTNYIGDEISTQPTNSSA